MELEHRFTKPVWDEIKRKVFQRATCIDPKLGNSIMILNIEIRKHKSRTLNTANDLGQESVDSSRLLQSITLHRQIEITVVRNRITIGI